MKFVGDTATVQRIGHLTYQYFTGTAKFMENSFCGYTESLRGRAAELSAQPIIIMVGEFSDIRDNGPAGFYPISLWIARHSTVLSAFARKLANNFS